ncbi:MAG: transglycosylase SLT domain-containing protein [Myxococcales bacterium]|nr:MAG: transglycosylase SLT domain-containing protein [Myxococcales bacterium]
MRFCIYAVVAVLSSGLAQPCFAQRTQNIFKRGQSQNQSDLWLGKLQMPILPIYQDERVLECLHFFHDDRRGQNRIKTWFARGEIFENYIREILQQYGFPEDLFYVAMVESGFDLAAKSFAGAGGPWQFVRVTAEEYDLQRNRWIDERYDLKKATMAAGTYLVELKERFGTWPLAFAAFNMGAGALSRAIRKYNTNDYYLLSHIEAGLPFETVHYVARIIACCIAGYNRKVFGINNNLSEELALTSILMPPRTSLAYIAKKTDVSLELLKQLNPCLRKNRTPPESGGYNVLLPKSSEASAMDLAYTPPSSSEKNDAEHIKTSLRLNNAEHEGLTVSLPIVDHKQTHVVTIPEFRVADKEREEYYFLVPDTLRLNALCTHFGISLDDVQRWNNIDPNALVLQGMYLRLYLDKPDARLKPHLLHRQDVDALILGSLAFFDHHEHLQDRVRLVYSVKDGDTLKSIARRFDLSVGSLTRINRFSRYRDLHPGEQIVVYTAKRRNKSTPN